MEKRETTLTPHQQEVLDKAITILKSNDRLLIKGSAGVGKTFLLNELIEQLYYKEVISRGSMVLCSAPTNKAVKVIMDKIHSDKTVEFATTHSALRLKRKINYKDGSITFEPEKNIKYPPLEGVRVLIIDEASMLSTDLLMIVEETAKKQKCKVIFVGDDKQLNPVKENISPVFLGKPNLFTDKESAMKFIRQFNDNRHTLRNVDKKFYVHIPYHDVELIEIIRQGDDNPIINLSRNLDKIKTREPNYTVGQDEYPKGYLYSYEQDLIIDRLAQANGTDEMKYLAYTNREVDNINKLVRDRIYNGSPKKIELGETLIFNTPYREQYFTNEEIRVNKLEIVVIPFKYGNNKRGKEVPDKNQIPRWKEVNLKVYSINPYIEKTTPFSTGKVKHNILVVHEESQKQYDLIVKELQDKARNGEIGWVDYYEFIETFADLKYNHAITVHKSQGSTFKTTIINVKDININKNITEHKRLLYTAVTRASDLVVLYNV